MSITSCAFVYCTALHSFEIEMNMLISIHRMNLTINDYNETLPSPDINSALQVSTFTYPQTDNYLLTR